MLTLAAVLLAVSATAQTTSPAVPCSATGAPPIRTVKPTTIRPLCIAGTLLRWKQEGVERYACLNLPIDAKASKKRIAGRKWPLIIYLHGSLSKPASIYREGHGLFELRDTFKLSPDPKVRGFILLSPEGRRATPWPSSGTQTGTGFHWDEWYRDPKTNLDVAAIDHFFDAAIATGLVDTKRVYVFGWSNGAFMAALYGVWRSDRIAAIGQYAGGNPWTRPPCAMPIPPSPHVPLILMRNLCDALASCSMTSDWIAELQASQWPFESVSLTSAGAEAPASEACTNNCGKLQGLHNHIRFPQKAVFEKRMLPFFREHALR